MLAPDGKDSADAFGEETADCIADVWSSAPEEASGAGGAGERLTDCTALHVVFVNNRRVGTWDKGRFDEEMEVVTVFGSTAPAADGPLPGSWP